MDGACNRAPGIPDITSLPPSSSQTNSFPPVPPRVANNAMSLTRPPLASNFGYGGLSNPYGFNSGFGMGGLGGMGMGGLGGMGGFGNFGSPADGSTTQTIENQMRPAFESVLSVVQAAASVTAVLESSYMAVYSCVRAVSGLADHFGRLNLQLRSLIASLGVVRWVRRWLRRLLDWMGVAPAQRDRVWRDVQERAALATEERQRVAVAGGKGGKWTSVVFMAVVLGAPALVWKLVSAMMNKTDNDWTAQGGTCFVGRSKFNFTATNQDELSMRLGETFRVAPKEFQSREQGWLMACNSSGVRGLLPADYVEILGRLDTSKSTTQLDQLGAADPATSSKPTLPDPSTLSSVH